MKILLDANISWKLVNILKPVFGECSHVDLIGLDVPVEDIDIWNYAQDNGYIIVTKDNDFVDLLEVKGFPPKVVLLKTGNNSSQALAALLNKTEPMIKDFENSNLGLLEIVNSREVNKNTCSEEPNNELFGIWKNKKDIKNVDQFVRNLRKKNNIND